MEIVNICGNTKSLLWSTAIALWLFWLWQRRDLYRFSLKFPGEWGAPLIGSFYKIIHLNCKSLREYKKFNYYDFLSDLFPFMKKQFESFNTTCCWLGTKPIIFTQDPEFIEKVLSSPDLLNKAKTFYDPFYKLFAGGIIASPGEICNHKIFEILLNKVDFFTIADKWVHTRKMMNPSFNHTVLLSFFPTFNKAKRLALSKFDALVGKGEHKLLDMLQRITLGITVGKLLG